MILKEMGILWNSWLWPWVNEYSNYKDNSQDGKKFERWPRYFFKHPVALSINDTDNDDHTQLDTKCFQLSILWYVWYALHVHIPDTIQKDP